MIYEEYGNTAGEILLFIHGGGVDAWMWQQQIPYFSEDFHILVPTLQGHGARSGDSGFSIRENAEEMLALLAQKDFGKPIHLAGFSIGAQVCLEMIHLAPDFFHSAMINSALVKPMKYAVPFIKPMIRLTYPLIQSRQFARIQARQLYVNGEYFESYYATSKKMKSGTLTEMLQENLAYSLPENLAGSTTRLLATVGTKETRQVKDSAALLSRLPGSQSILISDMGHGFPVAQPDAFNRLLSRWLQNSL
ncbi:alpha/beta fold hydrolase [Sporosarcina cascadiensis]|uniref:alpha/beta fold hydrolase n=1 Tax=Sporosarcina cascadiensis TaxID=2660747 RepID=UPI00129BC4AC|nr:alpha/beta hydrolase [Sporosarcina cascadiensis]